MKFTSIIPLRTTVFLAALLLLFVCGVTGCLSRPARDKQTFVFCAPDRDVTNAAAGGRRLAVRNLEIAPPFDGRSLVYRTGEDTYVRDPHAEFLSAPADELAETVREGLRSTGNFQSVVEPGSAWLPDILAEIRVSQMYGDFRPSVRPMAVITLHWVFLDAPGGLPGKILMEREYSRRVPLPAASAAALIGGWNQALAEIMDDVAADVRARGPGGTFMDFPDSHPIKN